MDNLYRKITIEIDEGNHVKHVEMSNEELLRQIALNKELKQQNERLRKERNKNLDNVMFLSKVNDEKQDIIDKALNFIDKELIPYGNEWHWDDYGIEDYVNKLKDILKRK